MSADESSHLYPEAPGERRVLGRWRYVVIPVALLLLIGLWGRPAGDVIAFYVTVSLGIGATIAAIELLLLPRLLPGRTLRPAVRWSLLAGELAVAVVAGSELGLRLQQIVRGIDPAVMRADVLRVAAVITLAVAAFDALRGRARKAQLGEEAARTTAALARLQALQARVNPHFLFNSLNAVAALIPEDPARAERCVEKLEASTTAAGHRVAIHLPEPS